MNNSASFQPVVPGKLVLTLFLFLLSMMTGYAQQDKIDVFIAQQMEKQKIIGLSLGIIKNGKVYKAKGYGFANLENKALVTNATVFKLASVSKHIVAAGILLLVQEGKLNLTDPVTKFYKDAPESWQQITIRHLLNHTSGLPRESPAFQPYKMQPDSLLIRAAYQEKLEFPTGTSWQYCNLGYFILADIIRQVSGRSFPEFMRERIFDKYGLKATQTTALNPIIPHRADGYVRQGRDTLLNAENHIALRPSGAFLSNMTDMLTWEMMMLTDQLLTAQHWQRMWTDTVRTTYKNPLYTAIYYGYGWNVTTYKNHALLYHAGNLSGFRNMYFRFPAERTAIIILTNTEPVDVPTIGLGVSDILHNE